MLTQKQSKKEKFKKGLASLFGKKAKGEFILSTEISNIKTEEFLIEQNLENSSSEISYFSSSQPRTIFLIGSTGKGKSTLANVLINKANEGKIFSDFDFQEIFKESQASVSGTRETQKEEFFKDNINYIAIDTVGLGDTKLKREEVLDKLAEAVYFARNGISQIFFVIGGRFDEKEMANYNLLKSIIFDKEVVNHTTIIRTNFKKFEDENSCQLDVQKMLAEDGKLAEIIQSCEKRVIYVDNPPLKLTPDDEEDPEKERSRIAKEIKEALNKRSKSGDKLLEHLQQTCQKKVYQPAKLQSLSNEIFAYMEEKVKKREELVKKEAEKIKKFEESGKLEKMEQISTQIFLTEDSENDSDELESINLMDNDQDKEIKLTSKEKIVSDNMEEDTKKFSQEKKEQGRENKKRTLIELKIDVCENELKELEETKELIEGIQKADEQIRQAVFNHIFSNIKDIAQVTGGDIFLNSVVEDNSNLLDNKLTFVEILEKKKELETKLLERKNDNQSLEKIKKEIEKKEWELVNFKKELLTIKEIFAEWQKRGFSLEQAQEWAEVLKKTFSPENDVDFCAWLENKKKSTIEEIVKYDIKKLNELRKEYDPQWLNNPEKVRKILLIGRSRSGKSSLANVLTNTNKFKESIDRISETRKIQLEQFKDKENNYLLIDTPSIWDTKISNQETLDIIAELIYLVQGGVKQIFFTVEDHFDLSETATYNIIKKIIFDNKSTKYTTIIRTKFPGFRSKEKCKEDIKLMLEKIQEKTFELEKQITEKKQGLKEQTTEKELKKMFFGTQDHEDKELKALSEVIESYQDKDRVVHVDNPSMDIDDKEKLELNSEDRNESRKILLEHLNKVCWEDYEIRESLWNIRSGTAISQIAKNYLDYLKKKEELAQELEKLKTRKFAVITQNSLDTNKEYELNKKDDEIEKNFETKFEKEKKGLTQSDQETTINTIGEEIARLENTISRLIKEINEKEKVIHQKVLKRIFHRHQEIRQELGGGFFLDNLVGKYDWSAIHYEFADEEIILKWLKEGFGFERTQEWAEFLKDYNFNPQIDLNFCSWLRDIKNLIVEKDNLSIYEFDELRNEYSVYTEEKEEAEKEMLRWSVNQRIGWAKQWAGGIFRKENFWTQESESNEFGRKKTLIINNDSKIEKKESDNGANMTSMFTKKRFFRKNNTEQKNNKLQAEIMQLDLNK